MRMALAKINWLWRAAAILLLAGLQVACGSLKLNPRNLNTRVAPLPFDSPISFFDFTYDAHLRRVIIPAGESGQLALVDPADLQVQLIAGFSRLEDPAHPVIGATAAAVGGNFLYALDQETISIKTIRLRSGSLVGSTPLQAAPGVIRYVSATGELWVTEKGLHQIEIFSVSDDDPPQLKSTRVISVPNGPEALLVDDQRGLAYTNRPEQGLTDVIQVMTHRVISQWGSGCSSARGMAVDDEGGYLLIACGEGKLVVMDIDRDGFQVTSQDFGGELETVAYNPSLHHVYLPSPASGVVAIFQLQKLPAGAETAGKSESSPGDHPLAAPAADPPQGERMMLQLLGTADTDIHARCVTADGSNNFWVCDPDHGQVFVIHDEFPDASAAP